MTYNNDVTSLKKKYPGSLIDFIFRRFTFFLAMFFTICLALAYWQLSYNHYQLIERTALQHAEVYLTAIEKFRTLYTSEVVVTARKAGLIVSHDYLNRKHAIPLPATLSMRLARELGEHKSGSKTFLYSPYPFPWRKEQGGLRDEFAEQAWARLSDAQDGHFYRFESSQGKRVLRYAKADLMRASCVNCHNTHPETPKSDWKVGETRGILEVIYPLEHAETLARVGLNQSLGILGTIFLAALVSIGFTVAKYRGMLEEISGRDKALHRS